jgi:hypothetical protein
MRKDIIVIGSSRAARNINSSVISKVSKLSCYNMGYPGSDCDFTHSILKLIVSSGNIPKYVILVVDDPKLLIPDSSLVYRYDSLYPLIKYDQVNDLLIERGKRINILSKISLSYRNNVNMLNAIIGHNQLNLPYYLIAVSDDGSMPLLNRSITYENMKYLTNNKYNKNEESLKLYNSLNNIRELCDKKNIHLIVLFPPNYAESNVLFKNRIKSILGSSSTYLDYSNYFKNKSSYYDYCHLIDNSARELSMKIGSTLSNISNANY